MLPLRASALRGQPAASATATVLASLLAAVAAAQPVDQPIPAREAAPIDIEGHWVSLITDDWVYRMITPARGDYAFVPLNDAGRREADRWDPARDAADGTLCKAYAAPAIMRLPSRVEISWADDETLRLDIDTGMQTREFHFDPDTPRGPRSWQGHSSARWEISGDTSRRQGFYRLTGSLGDVTRFGSLRVDTDNLRAGYLRRNGVPFSEDATMTEFYNLISEDDGTDYLVIQTFVADPQYLNQHFVRTMQFKREPNGDRRAPLDCADSENLFQDAGGMPRPDD